MLAVKQYDAILYLIERCVQLLELPIAVNDVGDVGIGQQPAAVRQCNAPRARYLAVGEAHLDRRRIAGGDGLQTLRDKGIKIALVRCHARATNKLRIGLFQFRIGHRRRAREFTGCAINEFKPQVAIEQNYAVFDLIERRAKAE